MKQCRPTERTIISREHAVTSPRVKFNVVNKLQGPVPTWRIDYLLEGSYTPVGVVFFNNGTTVMLALSERLNMEQEQECHRDVVNAYFSPGSVNSTRISNGPACIVYVLERGTRRRLFRPVQTG
jgi:hypothetical protein